MDVIKSLLVVWQNPRTRLYYHIGTLNYDGKKYTFEYTYRSKSDRNVLEAQQNGYHLHPAFPELRKTYQAKALFPAFNRRIPDVSRIGYQQILDEFSLPTDADRMDVLRETRGALAGDPYTFEEPLRLNGDMLSSNFYINGMRHLDHLTENWKNYIQEGDALIAELEEDNPYDQFAVKILTDNGMHLGYIPGIYAQAVHSLLKQNNHLELTVKQLRPHFAPQWWVRVELSAPIELDHTDREKHYNFDSLIFRESA